MRARVCVSRSKGRVVLCELKACLYRAGSGTSRNETDRLRETVESGIKMDFGDYISNTIGRASASRRVHVQTKIIVSLTRDLCDQWQAALLRPLASERCCFRNYAASERAREEKGEGGMQIDDGRRISPADI